VFGFSDAMAKLVFDVAARQQVGLTLLTGRSRVDGDEDIQAVPLAKAAARTSVVNMSWRSTVGSTTVITQRAYVIRQGLAGDPAPHAPASSRLDQEVVYRPTAVTSMPFGLLEMGAHVGRTTSSRDQHSEAAWTRSGYVHVWSQVAERLTISPGIRVSDASHIAGPMVTPWFSAELGVGRRWTIGASTGLSHQSLEVGRAYAVPSFDRTQPESAAHLDVSIRQQLTANLRWQATLYQRRERSILDVSPLLEEIDPVNAIAGIRGESRLAGSAHGLEIVMERQSPSGFSGWGAYTYGWARQTDPGRGQTFWADFDQRHAMTAFGVYRWRNSTNLGATLRIGSGAPISGYLSSRGTDLFIGTVRNAVRLPTYARLDVRAGRSFAVRGQRLHVFVEAVNLLDRVNIGATAGSFGPDGRAVGFIEPLTPARATAGVTVGF
jgi:hypothetical protein